VGRGIVAGEGEQGEQGGSSSATVLATALTPLTHCKHTASERGGAGSHTRKEAHPPSRPRALIQSTRLITCSKTHRLCSGDERGRTETEAQKKTKNARV
jgi:hypothetical protein